MFGSWQQTDTHWSPVTTVVAVLVSVAPIPLSVPGAAPPSFWVTPNHGSGPIWNEALAGVATMVAVLPTGTDAVTVVPVDAVPPLIVTEHQSRKFMTVSVALPPPLPLELPLELLVELPLELPLELLVELPLELLVELPLELPLELLVELPLELPLELLELPLELLHAPVPPTVNAAKPATVSRVIWLIVVTVLMKASLGVNRSSYSVITMWTRRRATRVAAVDTLAADTSVLVTGVALTMGPGPKRTKTSQLTNLAPAASTFSVRTRALTRT